MKLLIWLVKTYWKFAFFFATSAVVAIGGAMLLAAWLCGTYPGGDL